MVDEVFDILVIGGGVNGTGIARDAAGRGLRVALVEMNDLASATSSASTKLFHGGLRYLEYFEIGLVRESLIERERLWSAMPHISWPMRFVLPYHRDMRFEGGTPTSRILSVVMPWMKGRRPGWLIRLGLFLYDHLGGRKILPGTTTLDLTKDPVGRPLKDHLKKAFEYSDCWVEDARLVMLNARDAQARGAQILTHTKVVSAVQDGGIWTVQLEGKASEIRAKSVVNAAGPWVEEVMSGKLHRNTREGVRLVRGSHIVTRKLFDHDKPYFFQGTDNRIIFAIPYEGDFTLIGTTDQEHPDPNEKPICTPAEQDYLCKFASQYFKQPVTRDDIVWTYSGVRPLYDDGASSATEATRDYVLSLDAGGTLLNIFGGKITTHRRLSEEAVEKLRDIFPDMPGDWTAGVAMPGGDFPVTGVQALIDDLLRRYSFLDPVWAKRMVRAYGTEAVRVLGDAETRADLGRDFGATLSESEVRWMIGREFVETAEDAVWRRTKLGLRMSGDEIAALDQWIRQECGR